MKEYIQCSLSGHQDTIFVEKIVRIVAFQYYFSTSVVLLKSLGWLYENMKLKVQGVYGTVSPVHSSQSN